MVKAERGHAGIRCGSEFYAEEVMSQNISMEICLSGRKRRLGRAVFLSRKFFEK
jgi:hypothetical protein